MFVLLVRALFPGSSRKEDTTEAKEMIKDPNCETYVPKSEALQKNLHGKEYFFCSKTCADEFTKKNA
ncbi:MAG: YHS domain-containing protein [Nitrospinaceae bacterium]